MAQLCSCTTISDHGAWHLARNYCDYNSFIKGESYCQFQTQQGNPKEKEERIVYFSCRHFMHFSCAEASKTKTEKENYVCFACGEENYVIFPSDLREKITAVFSSSVITTQEQVQDLFDQKGWKDSCDLASFNAVKESFLKLVEEKASDNPSGYLAPAPSGCDVVTPSPRYAYKSLSPEEEEGRLFLRLPEKKSRE